MHSLGRWAGLGLVVAAAVATPAAQQPRVAPGEPVAIDFFASGRDGVVFDLRPDEVTLKVDGRVRPVRSLRFISLPAGAPATPVGPAAELEPPFGTNDPEAGGRWVTIVVDHESIKPSAEKNAMIAAVKFVNALGPRDHVSYMRLPRGGVEVPFTTNHHLVTEPLRRFIGTAPREQSERDRACRSRELLNDMRNLLEEIAPLTGPKIVAVISSGVLNPRRDAPLNAPPGQCEIRTEDFHNVRMAAAQARAYVWVVQPDHLEVESARNAFLDPTQSRFAAADEDRHGLQSLAGATEGVYFQVVGPEDARLPEVARATAGYYIATFDPEPSERNAATHRVELGVTRDQVRVRARPEVTIPRPPKQTASANAREMLRDDLLYRALPLRAVAYPSAGEVAETPPSGIEPPPGARKVKILAALEPVERGVKIVSAVFGLIDTRGKLVVQWTADSRELATVPVVTAGEASPGPYRLRVAAIDSNGRQGKVEYEFFATLTDAKPLTLSAMALGTSGDGGFAPRLVFGSDQSVVTYFEAYGAPPKPDSISVRLEVATSPDERALVTAVPRVLTASPDRRMVIGALPIAALPPSDYVVRAIVSVDGRPVGRLLRTLRKATAR